VKAPYDLEAERAALGACLASPVALSAVLSVLKEEDFYSERHRAMYQAISKAAESHKEVDHHVARPYCDEETGKALLDLYDSVPTASNASHYADQVKIASRARKTLDAADRIRAQCLSDDYAAAPSFALSEIEDLSREDADGGAKTFASSLDEFAALIAQRRKNYGVTGIRTGIGRLDRALGGLNRGTSYIIAARPGIGKSLVAGQIAQTAASQDYRVLVQTPEMSEIQYLDRLAHGMAGVDYEIGREGRITDSEEGRINAAAQILAKLPLYFDDHGTQTVSRVRANVMRLKPDLLIVDYLGYMTPDDPRAGRTQQVGQISRGLTRIKADFNIPVVLAAQLNREVEKRHEKRPNLADLRDSGEIEQDADAVMFLHRPGRWDESAPQDELEIHCEKWRFGDLWQTTVYLKPGANWVVNERGEAA
jgi:replicative DNA helicase